MKRVMIVAVMMTISDASYAAGSARSQLSGLSADISVNVPAEVNTTKQIFKTKLPPTTVRECAEQIQVLSRQLDAVTDHAQASAILTEMGRIDSLLQELNRPSSALPPYNPNPATVRECVEQIQVLSRQLDAVTDHAQASAILTEMGRINSLLQELNRAYMDNSL